MELFPGLVSGVTPSMSGKPRHQCAVVPFYGIAPIPIKMSVMCYDQQTPILATRIFCYGLRVERSTHTSFPYKMTIVNKSVWYVARTTPKIHWEECQGMSHNFAHSIPYHVKWRSTSRQTKNRWHGSFTNMSSALLSCVIASLTLFCTVLNCSRTFSMNFTTQLVSVAKVYFQNFTCDYQQGREF